MSKPTNQETRTVKSKVTTTTKLLKIPVYVKKVKVYPVKTRVKCTDANGVVSYTTITTYRETKTGRTSGIKVAVKRSKKKAKP